MRSCSSVWPAITLVLLAFASVFAPGCTGEGERQRENRQKFACDGNVARRIEPPLQTKEIVPGAIRISYRMAESGASISNPIEAISGRAGMTPVISLHYNSENHFDTGLGVGFPLAAGSFLK